jgi:transposase
VPKGKTYTPEFKEQAARRVAENSLPIAQVARELGVNDTALGFWVKSYKEKISGQPVPEGVPDAERVWSAVRLDRFTPTGIA